MMAATNAAFRRRRQNLGFPAIIADNPQDIAGSRMRYGS
jgi:hypothetical protein